MGERPPGIGAGGWLFVIVVTASVVVVVFALLYPTRT